MPSEYAFIGHESAAEALFALARKRPLSSYVDPELTALPPPELCVTTVRGFNSFSKEVDLASLGVVVRPIHLLVPFASARSKGKNVRFHVWGDALPDGAFLRVHDRVLVSAPAFTVLQVAIAGQPTRIERQNASEFAEFDTHFRKEHGLDTSSITEHDHRQWRNIERIVRAAMLAGMLAGTFNPTARDGDGTLYNTAPLMTRGNALTYIEAQPRSKGNDRARRAVGLSFDGAASHMELALALILTLPTEMGGFGLPRPKLNVALDDGTSQSEDTPRFIGDLVWEDERVVVEYNSREYHTDKLADDAERANTLTSAGWQVYWVTGRQAFDLSRLSLLAHHLATALNVNLEKPDDLSLSRRVRLHALLMLGGRQR